MKIYPQYAEGLPRPDLRWVEDLLGESLHIMSAGEANRPSATKHLDMRWIPMGNFCYHPWPYSAGARPCPFFNRTEFGTATCAFMNVEAYDATEIDWVDAALVRRFGSMEEAHRSGVRNQIYLPDEIKICGVNEANPSFLEDALLPDIALYEAMLDLLKPNTSTVGVYKPAGQQQLINTAISRFRLWMTLCEMVGPVPHEAIARVMAADQQFRSPTQDSDEPMKTETARNEVLTVPNPKQQFWYFYRCHPPAG